MATIRVYKHYIRLPFLLLGVIEFCILIGAVLVAVYLRHNTLYPNVPGDLDPLLPRALLFASLMVASMFAMGLYQGQLREGIPGIFLRLSVSFIAGTISLSLFAYLFQAFLFGRGVLSLALLISFFCIGLVRIYFIRTVDRSVLRRRILVLGAGQRAANFARLRRKADQRGFNIIGFIHIQGEEDVIEQNRVLQLEGSLLERCLELEIEEIVVAITDRRKKFPVHELLDCRIRGIDVVDALTFFERESGKIVLELLNPSWLIFSEGWTRGRFRLFLQRAFDVLLCIFLLLMISPLIVLVVMAMALESGLSSPLLFRQVRIGENGKPFKLIKFRSMHLDDETQRGDEEIFCTVNRVTRVGAFMRKFRIDEIPQIYNILKGDMSIVGPRPERPEIVAHLTEQVPYYDERHLVKPGLAGWAQLNYPYGTTQQDAIEKLQFDLFYIKNHSLLLDFLILIQTAEIVLFGRGSK